MPSFGPLHCRIFSRSRRAPFRARQRNTGLRQRELCSVWSLGCVHYRLSFYSCCSDRVCGEGPRWQLSSSRSLLAARPFPRRFQQRAAVAGLGRNGADFRVFCRQRRCKTGYLHQFRDETRRLISGQGRRDRSLCLCQTVRSCPVMGAAAFLIARVCRESLTAKWCNTRLFLRC